MKGKGYKKKKEKMDEEKKKRKKKEKKQLTAVSVCYPGDVL